MRTNCLRCARAQQIKGYKVCRECYRLLWGVLINNLSAELELTDAQTEKLVKITDEMDTVLTGAEESGMDLSEYAEYLVGKAAECIDRLRNQLGQKEDT